MKLLKIIFPLTILIVLLCSCAPQDSANNPVDETPVDTHTYYTVEFDSQGGSTIPSQRVMENNPVVRPNNPSYENHSFIGWYRTASINEDTMWNFNMDRVTSDLILYAGWQSNVAPEVPTSSLTYTRVDNGYEVSGVGDEERIIIPQTYENESVVSIGESSFARKQITYVSIPDSVVSIGLNAFHNASSLKQVNIGTNSNLTSIGNNAFSGNSSLESIYLPAKLESLGSSVFNNASILNSIVVSSENTHFYSTGSNLIQTDTQTLIRGSNTSVIPDGVRSITSAAFRRSSIASITIPATVEEIGSYAFDDCASLTEILASDSNPAFSSQSGVLYNKDKTALIKVPEGCNSIVVLPSTLTELPSFTFDGLSSIPSIYIPKSITNIRSFAFRGVAARLYYEGSQEEWNLITKHSTWGGAALEVVYNSSPEDIENPIDVYTIYFSATGSTRGIANLISQYTESDIYEITALNPYSEADLNYSNSSCRANQEQNDPTSRPEIGSENIDLSKYEVIYLGYPIWWGKAPKIIYTFLDAYDLSSKIIIPFCTSSSSSIGGSLSDLRALEPNATWLNGQRFSANASLSTIQVWVDSLNY